MGDQRVPKDVGRHGEPPQRSASHEFLLLVCMPPTRADASNPVSVPVRRNLPMWSDEPPPAARLPVSCKLLARMSLRYGPNSAHFRGRSRTIRPQSPANSHVTLVLRGFSGLDVSTAVGCPVPGTGIAAAAGHLHRRQWHSQEAHGGADRRDALPLHICARAGAAGGPVLRCIRLALPLFALLALGARRLLRASVPLRQSGATRLSSPVAARPTATHRDVRDSMMREGARTVSHPMGTSFPTE